MQLKLLVVSLFITLFSLTGCLNLKPTDDPTRYYALSPSMGCQNNKTCEPQKIIGLARIFIPEYLDRAKIIYENTANEYKIAEYHRWTESLESNVSRVIAQNLSAQLPNVAVIQAPWKNLGKPDYELHIQILDFKTQHFLCQTLLHVRYSIIDVSANQTIHTHEACIKTSLNQEIEEYLMVVNSMDDAVAQLSCDIASNFKTCICEVSNKSS